MNFKILAHVLDSPFPDYRSITSINFVIKLLVLLFFVIISLEKLSEILVAPIFFSESVFELYMKKSLEADSVYF